MVLAMADAVCAVSKMLCHCRPPPSAFSGTTTVSPGCSVALSNSPPHRLLFVPMPEPSARITKIAFLLASCVGPPDWPRYQFAPLPGRNDTAVGLKTCPVTMMYLAPLGITRTSPALTSTSADVSFQRSILEVIRIVTRPNGGLLLSWFSVDCHC